jgi:hypothetical protein
MSKQHKEFFESTLKSGAKIIGTQLLAAVGDANQPADVFFGKVLLALKTGALMTGQEVMKSRLEKL